MVKTFLPDNLSSTLEIDKIYTKLSKHFYNYKLYYSESAIDKGKKESVKKAFDYKYITPLNRHIVLTTMNISVCPYCNMNYTFNYRTRDNYKSIADIDHFYNKNEYPEYALCLYNFVPSCPVCNSRLKGAKSVTRETNIFPHEDSFSGKAKFCIVNLVEMFINKEDMKLELVNCTNDEKVNKSVETFQINGLYKNHKILAYELMENTIVYNESYTKGLQSTTDIFENNLSVKQLIFGSKHSEESYSRISLGKLKMDLLNQLGVY